MQNIATSPPSVPFCLFIVVTVKIKILRDYQLSQNVLISIELSINKAEHGLINTGQIGNTRYDQHILFGM